MHHTSFARGRLSALAPAAVLLLALCLLAVGVQALTDTPALVIDGPGLYTLDHDLSSDSTIGVLINSSDVVFDGMGHSITGTGANGSIGHPRHRALHRRRGRDARTSPSGTSPSRDWGDGIRIAEVSGTVVEDVVAEQNGVGLIISPTTGITSGNTHPRLRLPGQHRRRASSLDLPDRGHHGRAVPVTGNGVGIVRDSRSATARPNTLADSEISGNTGDGLNSHDGSFSVVRNCTVSANGDDGLEFEHGGSRDRRLPHREQRRRRRARVATGRAATSTATGSKATASASLAGGDWPCHVRNNVLNNTDNGFFGIPLDSGYTELHEVGRPEHRRRPVPRRQLLGLPERDGLLPDAPRHRTATGSATSPITSVEDATDYLPLALRTDAHSDPHPDAGVRRNTVQAALRPRPDPGRGLRPRRRGRRVPRHHPRQLGRRVPPRRRRHRDRNGITERRLDPGRRVPDLHRERHDGRRRTP